MAGKKKKNAQESGKLVIDVNKKARRDYEITEMFEAGISLLGSEVKSVRASGVSLRDSYVRVKDNECMLVGCHIGPYEFARQDSHEPYRDRKLLLHRREISRLFEAIKQKGLTVVPLRIYFNKAGKCKLEIGLGRGKKLFDKREDIKTRDAKRQIERALKSR